MILKNTRYKPQHIRELINWRDGYLKNSYISSRITIFNRLICCWKNSWKKLSNTILHTILIDKYFLTTFLSKLITSTCPILPHQLLKRNFSIFKYYPIIFVNRLTISFTIRGKVVVRVKKKIRTVENEECDEKRRTILG